MQFELKVNGKIHAVRAEADTPLLYILRNDLNLSGAKFGCGQAQCGACSVLVDEIEQRSCVYTVGAARWRSITTIEGLGTAQQPSALQRAFIHEQAGQCGYCSSGMIVAAQALLHRNPKPSAAEVKQALEGHLCRCGAHNRIVRAVLRASNAVLE
jgi:nicotinate dehydrogenase subunit A